MDRYDDCQPAMSPEEREQAEAYAANCMADATREAADQRRREDASEPDPLPDVDLPW